MYYRNEPDKAFMGYGRRDKFTVVEGSTNVLIDRLLIYIYTYIYIYKTLYTHPIVLIMT